MDRVGECGSALSNVALCQLALLILNWQLVIIIFCVYICDFLVRATKL